MVPCIYMRPLASPAQPWYAIRSSRSTGCGMANASRGRGRQCHAGGDPEAKPCYSRGRFMGDDIAFGD